MSITCNYILLGDVVEFNILSIENSNYIRATNIKIKLLKRDKIALEKVQQMIDNGKFI